MNSSVKKVWGGEFPRRESTDGWEWWSEPPIVVIKSSFWRVNQLTDVVL
jgi:hypothetical protein